jgi:hypothetical protein
MAKNSLWISASAWLSFRSDNLGDKVNQRCDHRVSAMIAEKKKLSII